MNLLSSTTKPTELFSQSKPGNNFLRVFQFPIMRIFVMILFFIPIMLVNSVVVFQIIEKVNEPWASYINMLRVIVSIPLFILSYKYYCRVFEKREAVEVSFSKAVPEWGFGWLVAVVLVLFFVLLIMMFGEFEVLGFRSYFDLLMNFLMFSIGALFQEMILLCIIFRLLEEWLGSWKALLGSLLLFAGVHILNDNESLVSVVMLMFSSLVLIAPFILTRRIWVSWGFHAGWNFMQAGVFGMANSGLMFDGWMITQVKGPEWLTGGPVGIEASYLAVTVDFLLGLLVLIWAMKAGQMVKSRKSRVLKNRV